MRLSIITINYNNRKGLAKTIASVKEQTCQDFEYIVVDGDSNDGSVDVIQANSSYITKYVIESDKGIYDAMNKGVALAEGDYCLFLNSSDVLADKFVMEDVLPALQGNKDFYTGIEHIKGKHKDSIVFPEEEVTMQYMWFANMRHQSTFIKTSLLKRRPYQTKYKIVADWEQNLYELFHNNATYGALDRMISIFDYNGMSNQPEMGVVISEEKRDAFERIIGKRVTQWIDNVSEDIWTTWCLDGCDTLSINNRIPTDIQTAIQCSKNKTSLCRDWIMLKASLKLLFKDIWTLCKYSVVSRR